MAVTKFSNPRKKFQFSISFYPASPFNSWQAQKVTLPDTDIEMDLHGDTNHDIKTAGRVTIGELTIERIMSSKRSEQELWAWFATCQSSLLGGGLPPNGGIGYKRSIEISEYAEDGVTVIDKWVYNGVWPTKVNGIELSRTESGNTIESVEFAVDTGGKVISPM